MEVEVREFLAAISFLTVLPLRIKNVPSVGRVVVFFPLVGGLYGFLVVGWVFVGGFLSFLNLLLWWV